MKLIKYSNKAGGLIIFLILTAIIASWFRNGLFIYHDLAFSFIKENYQATWYLWSKINNLGEFSPIIIAPLALSLFLKGVLIFKNLIFAEFLIFFFPLILIYFTSFKLFFYLSNDRMIAYLTSFFYVFNLYTLCRLYDGHLFLIIVYGFLPIIIYLLYKYLIAVNYFPTLFYLLIIFLFINNGLNNPPMGMGTIYLPVFIFLLVFLLFYGLNRENLKRIGLFSLLLFFINFYWILPTVYFSLQGMVSSYIVSNQQIGFNWPDIVDQKGGLINLLRFNGHWLWNAGWAGDMWYYFSSKYDSSWVYIFTSFIFSILGFVAMVFYRRGKDIKNNFFYFFVLLLLVVYLFLANGIQAPLGEAWKFIYNHVPFFNIFRAPPTKFGGVIVFAIAILIIYSLSLIKKKSKAIFYIVSLVFFVSTIIVSFPTISGKIFLREKKGEWDYRNIPYLPERYLEIAQVLNKNKIDTNYYEYPFAAFGFFDLGYKKHEGIDLLSLLTDRTLISICSGFSTDCNIISFFQENLSEKMSVFPLLNSRYILNRLDTWSYEDKTQKWQEKFNMDKSSLPLVYNDEMIKIFKVPDELFLPHFYVPKSIITSIDSSRTLSSIAFDRNYQIRSAIYFKNQNKDRPNQIQNLSAKIDNPPILEFRKTDPTKYRIRVHGAKGDFPLVFSESFNEGWKAYLNQNVKIKMQNDNLKFKNEEYKILDGNEEDQASREELAEFIEKGLASTLGDGKEKKITHKKWEDNKEKLDYVEKYKIDFISKNFQDTIQNDNLPSGNIFETWFKKPLPEENHLMVNGYANSWLIDVNKVCKVESGKLKSPCVKNPDGSYDFELIVEFWPQRLFYVGLFISGMTLLSCFGYLIYDRRKKKEAD